MSSADYGAVGVQNRTRTLFGQVMWAVAATAGLFALGAYLGRNLGNGLAFVFFILAFVCLIGMRFAIRSSAGLGMALLFGVGLLMGLGTSPMLVYYANADPRRCGRPAVRRPCSSPAAAPSVTPPAPTCPASRVSASGRYLRSSDSASC
jgi:hypothetical protein